MEKKKGIIIIVSLIFLMGIVNAAWIIYYHQDIVTEIIGQPEHYSMSEQFEDSLNLNTTESLASISTNLTIEELGENINVTLDMSTHKINLTSETECHDYEKDCKVIIDYIYNNGTEDIRQSLIITEGSRVSGDANFTLLEDYENILEYRIECVEDSCPQRIISNITLEQIS
jgi:hypothetical protein